MSIKLILKESSKIFRSNEQYEVSISLNTNASLIEKPWLQDSINFSTECLSIYKACSEQHPIVISGLPIDLTISLCLSAWFLGRAVAFVDPDLTKNQQLSLIKKLQPSYWISSSPLEAPLDIDTIFLNLNSEVGEEEFSQALSYDEYDNNITSYQWSPTETAIILFTSGSTGSPKGVCHSLQNLIFSAQLFQEHFKVTAEDNILNFAPLHTMSGLRCSLFLPLTTYCETQREPIHSDLNTVIKAIEGYPCSIMIVGPKLLETLLPISSRVSSLKLIRMVLSTGATLSTKTRELLWDKHRIPIYNYYGLTETCGLVIAEDMNKYNPLTSSIGFPCKHIKITVFDENKQEEQEEGKGLLRIYSPANYLGYLGNVIAKKDYFDTGDIATIKSTKEVTLHGRLDKSIKSTTTLWLRPQAIEVWLKNNCHITDYAIKTEDNNISCYLVTKDSYFNTLIEKLITDLGSAYREVKWQKVEKIQRTNLSKINWNLLEKQ